MSSEWDHKLLKKIKFLLNQKCAPGCPCNHNLCEMEKLLLLYWHYPADEKKANMLRKRPKQSSYDQTGRPAKTSQAD